MIEKHIHMAWVGRFIPRYAYDMAFAFKHMNPSFKFTFHHAYAAQDLQHLFNTYTRLACYYEKLGRSRSQVAANIWRIDILNNVGGIYVDCDCVPCKPFDEVLLNRDAFVVMHKHNSMSMIKDCYFMGKSHTCAEIQHYEDISGEMSYIVDQTCSYVEQLKDKMHFIKRDYSKINLDCGQYVKHIGLKSWSNSDGLYSKFI